MSKEELTKPGVVGGWYLEINDQWKGQAMGIKVKETLFEGKSDYQDVAVYETETYGKMMTLDGVIQSTQRDEFSYHEMIAHLPLFSHPNPEHICVIGGGDGGVLREVMKHPSVKSAVLCDIDAVVIEQSKVHLKHLSVGFEDPRSEVICGDGFEFLKGKAAAYDVIIVDSSDPDGGVTCSQGECMWLHLPLIKSMQVCCKEIFGSVDYAYTCIPTYPSGQIGFMVCGKDAGKAFQKPLRTPSPEQQKTFQYYSAEVHAAAFVLPEFARKELRGP